MSALGHKRTFAVQKRMSALPPKADMCGALTHVRYVQEGDIASALGLFSPRHQCCEDDRNEEKRRHIAY
jgi:hypothetical protein